MCEHNLKKKTEYNLSKSTILIRKNDEGQICGLNIILIFNISNIHQTHKSGTKFFCF